MTLPANARLVAYLRDSGGPDQDLSLIQQEAALRSWAAEHGHTITRVFSDEALSGTRTAGRHGFEAMLQHFRSSDCPDHGLVLWKFSRLARDFDDAQFFKADLRRRGFVILAIQDKIPEGSMGRFFEAAIDYMNERYSHDLASDVQRGLRHALITYGALPGNQTKPGFKREKVIAGAKRNGQPHVVHRWVVDPQTASKVLDAFRMKAAGASIKEIHAKHHLYYGVHGYTNLWQDEIYRGVLHFGQDPANQIVIRDYVPPIVDERTWLAVQERMQHFSDQHASSLRHPRRVASRFLLSGLVKCDRCDYMLIGQSNNNKYGNRFGYYICRSGKLRPDLGCSSYGISAPKLETAVLNSLKEFILAPTNLQRIHSLAIDAAYRSISKDQSSELKAKWKHVNAELDHVVTAIAAAGHSQALLKQLRNLEAQRDELEAQLATAEQTTPPVIPSLGEIAASAEQALNVLGADRSAAKRMLQSLIKEIRVRREGKSVFGEIIYFLPGDEIASTGLGYQQPTGKDFGTLVARPA